MINYSRFLAESLHALGRGAFLLALLALFAPPSAGAARPTGPLPWTGVSLAGGEFDEPEPAVRPVYGQSYVYPTASEMDYFAGRGVNVVRFPFHWTDLQPALNEPHGLPAAQWLGAANAALAAIRRAGAHTPVLVPGIAWTGAHSWASSGNAEAMKGVADPENHYLFEVHQYLDADSSGTKPEAVSATVGSERLREFTLWCRRGGRRAFLGEFGAADNPTAAAAAGDMLTSMEQNRDVWAGWTWWAAGAWWGDYMFTLEPKGGHDRPQMAMLRPHLQPKLVHPKPVQPEPGGVVNAPPFRVE